MGGVGKGQHDQKRRAFRLEIVDESLPVRQQGDRVRSLQ
jgi:hypothetical protein